MSPRNPHEPSCTECRTRKAKCSKERPSCKNCVATGRECVYLPKTTRTPLTRAHLASVEKRLGRFESAFKALFPSGDVDQVVNALIQAQPHRSSESTSSENGLGLISELTDHSGQRLTYDAGPENAGVISSNITYGGFDTTFISLEGEEAATLSTSTPADDEAYLVNSYFANYHPNHPFVDEDAFRKVYQSSALNTQSIAWQALCKAVMAMGAWCQCDPTCDVDVSLYMQAQTMLSQISLIEPGDLILIQALLLLSDFAQKRGMPEEGMQYLGIAVQKAVALGLHREQSQPALGLLEQEMKRRVWWSLYVFDSCAAKSFGRPLMLPDDSFMNVKPLLNITPGDLRPMDTCVPAEADGPTIYSGLIAQTDFHRMANRIYRHLVANSPVSVEQVARLEGQVDDWRNRCPIYLRDPAPAQAPDWLKLVIDRLKICDKNLRLLILRPFLMRWATLKTNGSSYASAELDINVQCALRCVKLASEIMALVLERIEQPGYSRLGVSFLLYCLFHGILIHVTFLKSGTALPNEIQFVKDIRTTKRLLSCSWLRADSQSAHWLEVIRTLCLSFET
ncbi:fungal-specific transcription factor domain-containing protein [Aspergillus bertholletiae]|uniref:Fungal-specific transcription factor domain-containing protein n=1 Tax=Aspergillus bertholletiae TaxID=1226010 RepID=A0A5N7BIP2_9EURO|nr:fungal-specific transcription factor domain-containing protein [Aspergillus bertholletiae]